jgi:hypothetical protein
MDRSDEYSADRRDIVVNDTGHRDILDSDRRDVLLDDAGRDTVLPDRDVVVNAERDDRDDEPNDAEKRTGDVLGLGGSPVPKMPGDPSTEHDPEAASQRRARMRDGESEGVSDPTPDRTKGATGIDMGAGGTGTGLSGE